MTLAEWSEWRTNFNQEIQCLADCPQDFQTLTNRFADACQQFAMQPLARYLRVGEQSPLLCTQVFIGLYSTAHRLLRHCVGFDCTSNRHISDAFKRALHRWLHEEWCPQLQRMTPTDPHLLTVFIRIWNQLHVFTRYMNRVWFIVATLEDHPSVMASILMEFKAIVVTPFIAKLMNAIINVARVVQNEGGALTDDAAEVMSILRLVDSIPSDTLYSDIVDDSSFCSIKSIEAFKRDAPAIIDGDIIKKVHDVLIQDCYNTYSSTVHDLLHSNSAVQYCKFTLYAFKAEERFLTKIIDKTQNPALFEQMWSSFKQTLVSLFLENIEDNTGAFGQQSTPRADIVFAMPDGAKYQLNASKIDMDVLQMFRQLCDLSKLATSSFARVLSDAIQQYGAARLNDAQTRLKSSTKRAKTTLELELVEELASFAWQLRPLWKDQPVLRNAAKVGLEQMCNRQVGQLNVARLIPHYIDELQRGKIVKRSLTSDDAKLEKLHQLMPLLMAVWDKDVMLESYRDLLAKRLLDDRPGYATEDTSMENTFLSVIKASTSITFTSKLESMLKETNASNALMQKYLEYVATEARGGCVSESHNGIDSFSATVLNVSFWPRLDLDDAVCASGSTLQLPIPMQQAMDQFRAFYGRMFPERKLKLHWTVGVATIRFRTNSQVKRLTATTAQAIVLQLFNTISEGESYTAQQISDRTGIPVAAVKRILHSLTFAPGREVLLKRPCSRTVQDSDEFFINVSFQSKAPTINLPVPVLQPASAGISKDVSATRAYAIDAAIVRTMKARNQLLVQDLTGEVMRQLHLRFHPDCRMIKRRVEDLIERDYLERHADNAQLLCYIA